MAGFVNSHLQVISMLVHASSKFYIMKHKENFTGGAKLSILRTSYWSSFKF